MLEIVINPKFTADVEVNTQATKGTLRVTYLAKMSDEVTKLEQQVAAEGKGPQGLLWHVVEGFDPVKVGGRMLTMEEGGLAALLNIPGVGPAMVNRFYRGLWEAVEGN